MTCYKIFYNALSRVISIGGSVVEFSPATRETGVRFPANALFSSIILITDCYIISYKNVRALVTDEMGSIN